MKSKKRMLVSRDNRQILCKIGKECSGEERWRMGGLDCSFELSESDISKDQEVNKSQI
jgi:hypothetical protein